MFLKHEMTLISLEEFCLCRQLLHFPSSLNIVQIIFHCPHLLQLITFTALYICYPSICQDLSDSSQI